MTNTGLLEQRIKESGYKKGYLAKCLGISLAAFSHKIKGVHEFKASEIQTICCLLGIKDIDEKERIFFAEVVN